MPSAGLPATGVAGALAGSAHTTRAILLARATAASLRGLRSSNASNQGEAVLLPDLAQRTTAMAPTTSNCRNRSLPARLMPLRRWRPPVERSFGF
jgi:hypothetical protein